MFKNLLTGLVLVGAVEMASATYQDGQTTERPQVILRYNTAGGVEGVETRTLTDKIIYRSQVEGGSDESLYGPALQYKNIFFQLPNRGEKFDFSKNDWRYPVGSVEGTILNLLVGAQDDWERRRQELLSLKDLGEGGEEAGIIQERINGILEQDSSDYRVFFGSRQPLFTSSFDYRYGDVDSGDIAGYYNASPYFFLRMVLRDDFRFNQTARGFQVLDTYLRDLSSVSKASLHRALVGQPDRRSGLMGVENNILVLTDTSDTGPNYAAGGQFDAPTVFPNGYVSAGLGSASHRAPVQVILDTLNFALKMKFPGLSEDQKGQAFYDMIQKFSQANQASILLTQKNYSSYLKAFYQILPKVLGDDPGVGKIQEYLVTRAWAANLVADPNSQDKGFDQIIGLLGSNGFFDLRYDNPSKKDLAIIYDFLRDIKDPFSLEITNSDVGDGITELADVLKGDKSLQALTLDSSKIGDSGAAALAFLLKDNKIDYLSLQNNKIGASGAVALGEGFKGNKTLYRLFLKGNNIGSLGASALGEGLKGNEILKWLDLDNNNIGDGGAIALAEGLKEQVGLEELYLNSNNFGAVGMGAFADSLKINKSPYRLYLNSNNIGDSGAIALAEGLAGNTSLGILELDSNRIGDAGAVALAKGLEGNTSLLDLSLKSNDIGDSGAIAMGKALKINMNLDKLYLSFNKIGDAGAAALAEGLKENTSLQQLGLSSNKIGNDGVRALVDGLKANEKVYGLSLSQNPINDTGAEFLLDLLALNRTFISLSRDGLSEAMISKLEETGSVNFGRSEAEVPDPVGPDPIGPDIEGPDAEGPEIDPVTSL